LVGAKYSTNITDSYVSIQTFLFGDDADDETDDTIACASPELPHMNMTGSAQEIDVRVCAVTSWVF